MAVQVKEELLHGSGNVLCQALAGEGGQVINEDPQAPARPGLEAYERPLDRVGRPLLRPAGPRNGALFAIRL